MKRVLAAAALVAAMLPVSATGAAPDARVSPAAREARQEWAKRYRDLARHLPVTPLLDAADAAAATETFHWAELLDAGDLDGDGAEDVADFRVTETWDDTTGSITATARVEARRGRDGALLWSTPLPGTYAVVWFDKVGASGKQGMIAVAYDAVTQDALVAGGGVAAESVTAYDGAGKPLWTYDTDAAYAGTVVGEAGGETFVDDEGDLVPGGGTDLLLDATVLVGAGDPLGLAGGYTSAVRLQVLDGATGAVRDIGTPYVTDTPGVYPAVVGDVSGDKRADVGVVVGEAAGPRLHVLSSADGADVLTVSGLPEAEAYGVFPIGDTTGDGRADVAVVSDSYEPGASKATAVDGARGTTLWSKPGRGAWPIGDANGRRGTEVAVAAPLSSSDLVGVTMAAYDSSGRASWSVSRSVDARGFDGYFARTSYGLLGDVTNDGVAEFGWTIVVTPMGANSRRDEGMVDGRRGRVLLDPAPDMIAARVTFDGRGDDFYTRSVKKGLLTVTAWRAEAPARVWETVLAVSSSDSPSGSFGLRADRDRCGDLAVTVSGARTTSYVISGSTGAPLWALTRSGDGAGVVSRPRARSVRRFARGC